MLVVIKKEKREKMLPRQHFSFLFSLTSSTKINKTK